MNTENQGKEASSNMSLSNGTFPRVVIIGAGFGGLSAAKQLAKAPFNVTIGKRDCIR